MLIQSIKVNMILKIRLELKALTPKTNTFHMGNLTIRQHIIMNSKVFNVPLHSHIESKTTILMKITLNLKDRVHITLII